MTDFEYYQATIILSILAVPVLFWVIVVAILAVEQHLDRLDERERRNRR